MSADGPSMSMRRPLRLGLLLMSHHWHWWCCSSTGLRIFEIEIQHAVATEIEESGPSLGVSAGLDDALARDVHLLGLLLMSAGLLLDDALAAKVRADGPSMSPLRKSPG